MKINIKNCIIIIVFGLVFLVFIYTMRVKKTATACILVYLLFVLLYFSELVFLVFYSSFIVGLLFSPAFSVIEF